MFGIGMPELVLILAVALIVIGPKKLPDLAKSLGKAMGEFKKATNDIKDSMQLDSGIQDVKTSFEDLGKELKKPVESIESSDPEPVDDTSPTAESTPDEAAAEAVEAPEADDYGTEAPDPEAADMETSEPEDEKTPKA